MKNLSNATLTVTGHRPNKLGNEYNLNGPITRKVAHNIQLVIEKVRPKRGICGLAIGVDMIFALLILKNGIPLTVAIPCQGQELKWNKFSRDLYHYILNHPLTTVRYRNDKPYSNGCMQERNVWMVDELIEPEDRLLAVWNGTSGGTKNCIDYAISQQKEIIYINL